MGGAHTHSCYMYIDVWEKLSTSGALLWRYQSDCRTKPRVHMTFCPLSKNCQLKNELVSVENTSKVGEKQFRMCGRGASPESPRSKFAVVGLRDRLAHHTSQLRVYMCKVRHGTQQSCGCLEDEERNCK